MAKLITKRSVDAFGPQEKQALLWDDEIKGFGLRVMPSGAKSYVYQYRIGGRGAPTRRYTIGKHGSLTPDQARKIARELSQQVARGVDPMETEREQREAKVRVAAKVADEERRRTELAFDTYLERFLAVGLDADLRPRTREGYESTLRKHIAPSLGSKPLPEISRKDIEKVLDLIPVKKPAVRRITFALLRMLFSFAVKREDIDASPLARMDAPKPVASRDRVLTDDELLLAHKAAETIETAFRGIYALLFATGQRRDEVAGLRWSEIDRGAATWILPAERSKNAEANVVPLNTRAIAELDRISVQRNEERPIWPKKGLVFTSTIGSSVSSYSRAKKLLDAKMLELAREEATEAGEDPEKVTLAPWRLHDARRTLATRMQQLGVRFEVVEAILNHKSGLSRTGVAAVYQRYAWEPEKREALERWSNYLDHLLAPDQPDDKIVPFRTANSSPGVAR